jgi:hypothetical protein
MCERCACFVIDFLNRPIVATDALFGIINGKRLRRHADKLCCLLLRFSTSIDNLKVLEAHALTHDAGESQFYLLLRETYPMFKSEMDYLNNYMIQWGIYKNTNSVRDGVTAAFFSHGILPIYNTIHEVHAQHAQAAVIDEYNGLYS